MTQTECHTLSLRESVASLIAAVDRGGHPITGFLLQRCSVSVQAEPPKVSADSVAFRVASLPQDEGGLSSSVAMLLDALTALLPLSRGILCATATLHIHAHGALHHRARDTPMTLRCKLHQGDGLIAPIVVTGELVTSDDGVSLVTVTHWMARIRTRPLPVPPSRQAGPTASLGAVNLRPVEELESRVVSRTVSAQDARRVTVFTLPSQPSILLNFRRAMFGGAAVAAAISEAASLVGKGAIMRDVASTFMAPLPAAATVQIRSELLRAGRGLTAVQVDFIDSASGRLGSRHMIGFSSAVPSRL